jgi:hypothetical protein
VGNLNITLWTKLYYKNMNISDLIDILRNTYNVDTDIIMYNNTAIYTSYMLENKKKEILNKDIYKLLGKNKNIILNVNISDEKDNSEIILIEII